MEELNLGKKLQAIRTSKKISVRKLAAMTNLTASMISQIENGAVNPVSYTHLRAHETDSYLVCRLLLEKKKRTKKKTSDGKRYKTKKRKTKIQQSES